MKPSRCILLLLVSGLALAVSKSSAADELFFRILAPPKLREEIQFHRPVLDEQGKLLPWTSYDHVLHLAMSFIANRPSAPVCCSTPSWRRCGLKTLFTKFGDGNSMLGGKEKG